MTEVSSRPASPPVSLSCVDQELIADWRIVDGHWGPVDRTGRSLLRPASPAPSGPLPTYDPELVAGWGMVGERWSPLDKDGRSLVPPAPTRLPSSTRLAKLSGPTDDPSPHRWTKVEDFYAAYHCRFVVYAQGQIRKYGVLDSAISAEDIVQEAWHDIHKQWDSVTISRTGWMYAVIRTKISHVRDREPPRPEANQGPLPRTTRALTAMAQADQVADIALARELGSSALKSLPHRRRAVAYLRFVRGATYEEIASALGISVGTVGAHVAGAREQLRDWFKVTCTLLLFLLAFIGWQISILMSPGGGTPQQSCCGSSGPPPGGGPPPPQTHSKPGVLDLAVRWFTEHWVWVLVFVGALLVLWVLRAVLLDAARWMTRVLRRAGSAWRDRYERWAQGPGRLATWWRAVRLWSAAVRRRTSAAYLRWVRS